MSTLPRNMETDPAYHRPTRRVVKKRAARLSQAAARALTARPDFFVEENVATLLISGGARQPIINGHSTLGSISVKPF